VQGDILYQQRKQRERDTYKQLCVKTDYWFSMDYIETVEDQEQDASQEEML
jgi:hypothetical protein